MPRLTLTHKTLIFIVITLAVIITLRVGSAQLIILKEFVNLEEDLTRQDMDRLFSAMNRECEAMTRILGDWCAWNDTLDYVQGNRPDYVANNLTPDTFANLGLHLVVLAGAAEAGTAEAGAAGVFRWARVYLPDAEVLAPLAPEMVQFLSQASVLWEHPSADSRRVGLFQTPMGLMLVASGPIVNSESKGPAGGTLIMARQFGPAAVAILEAQMQMEITIAPITEAPMGAMGSPHYHTHLSHSTIAVMPIDDDTLEATAMIADMAGHPAALISIKAPREVVAQGHRTIRYFLIWQSVSGVLVTLMAIVFVRRVILIPIARLNSQVSAITANSSFSDRLKITSSDEVGEMSIAINQMLTALEAAKDRQQAAYDELKHAQAQLVQSAKLASIGELAAGVAHELNQPLMVIRGTAQMLDRARSKASLNMESIGGQLNLIKRNTKRMMRIIEHLRTFSQQSKGERSQVDVNKTLESCFLLLGEQLRVDEIAVEMDMADHLPRVWCDGNQLEQVFLNLITNARDAIKEKLAGGGGNHFGCMYLTTRHLTGPPETVEVRVRDNGGGIAEDKLDWIFDPFFTTKEVGKGTGLGLSISYGIVLDHHGDLRVGDTGPEGTTFIVQLPTGSGVDEPAPVALES
jgi:signal transduction histidine kinase